MQQLFYYGTTCNRIKNEIQAEKHTYACTFANIKQLLFGNQQTDVTLIVSCVCVLQVKTSE